MVSLMQTEYDGTGKTLFPEPDTTIDVRDTFGIDVDWQVPAFSLADERVPDLDKNYVFDPDTTLAILAGRSEEHTSELQSLMRISYAVFCLQKTIKPNDIHSEADTPN